MIGTRASRMRMLAASLLLALPATAHAVDATIWSALGRSARLDARFEQTQHRRILKVPLKSTGSVRYARPDSLHWSVETPSASTFALEGGVAKMVVPDLGIDETIDLAQVPEANQIAASMMVWLRADPAAVARDFVATYGAADATLRPRDAKLAAILAEIHIAFAPDPWRVRGVTLTEPDGDRIEIAFHHVQLDGVSVPDPK